MSTFRERLEERMREHVHNSRFDEANRTEDCMAGARAALLLAAAEFGFDAQRNQSDKIACEILSSVAGRLRARAEELK